MQRQADAGDIESRIQLLIEQVEADPDSFEDWWMLARSYGSLGDHASAADAYRRAADLSGDRPSVLSAYAESMTLANGNKVPTAARLIFEQVLQKAPDPRARYYVALTKAQDQNFQGALDDWAALARESDSNAPWMALVRRDIINMARFTGADVAAYLPDATDAELALAGAANAGNGQSDNVIVDLEARLEIDPKDYKGWIELASRRAMSGDQSGALEALNRGRAEFQGAPFVLGKFDEAARDFGLDLLADDAGTSGPSAEDIANAQAMTEEDRNAMIAGMVAGLAARLEEQPDDPEGWMMLIRSESVLGNMDGALAAYQSARSYFANNPTVLSQLESTASNAGIETN